MKSLIYMIIISSFFGCGNRGKRETSVDADKSLKEKHEKPVIKKTNDTCSVKAVDFFKLKDSTIQSDFFAKLDSIRKIQYPEDDQENSIMVDITPEYLNQFLADIKIDSLEINNSFEKAYHFNIAPQDYTDPEICKDTIKVIFDDENCTFHLNVYNTFLVELDWCTESIVMYGFRIINGKVTDFWRQEAG